MTTSETAPFQGSVDTPTGHHAIPPGTAAVLGMLLLVGLVALGLRTFGSPSGQVAKQRAMLERIDISVPEWRPNANEQGALKAGFDARRKVPADQGAAEAKTLMAAHVAFTGEMVKNARSDAFKDRAAEWTQRAIEYASNTSVEAYMALGQQVADAYVEELAKPKRDLEALAKLGGSFIREARATGLVARDDRLTAGAGDVVRVALLTQWASALREQQPADALLSRQENMLLVRWRLAANPAVDAKRRAQLAEALARAGSTYPGMEALAARAAQEQRWAMAAAYYEQVAKQRPDDKKIQANLAFAKGKAAEPKAVPAKPVVPGTGK